MPNSPQQQQAANWIREGIRLGSIGEVEKAIGCFRRAADIYPESAEAHFNLGVAWRSSARLDKAVQAFSMAAKLNPNWPEAFFNLANAYRDARRHADAIECFEQALRLRPTYLKAMNNLASLWLAKGKMSRAERLLHQAIEIDPRHAPALFNLARVHRRKEEFCDALRRVQQAVQLCPQLPSYQLLLAELLALTGQIQASQDTVEALANRDLKDEATIRSAVLLMRQFGMTAAALQIIDKALAVGSLTTDLLLQRAQIHRTNQRSDLALAEIERVLELDPASITAIMLAGALHLEQGHVERAIECFRQVLQLRPGVLRARCALATALYLVRRFPEAKREIHAALRLKPNYIPARMNLAYFELAEGNLRDGWRELEWRLLRRQDDALSKIPIWKGEPVAGKTILLRAEQGLGDTLQFIRYANLIKSMGARVIAECQPPLYALLNRVSGVDQVTTPGSLLPNVDYQIRLFSLPGLLGTTLSNIPDEVPYLFADPARTSEWRKRLSLLGKTIVGIAWQGNPGYSGDRFRSIPLKHFEALSRIPNVALVSLQKHEGLKQLQAIDFSVHQFTDELDAGEPFEDTAAIIEACDLVVSSDTAIVHLAGGMGKTVWAALGYSAEWRWLQDGSTSPWYPTMRLYRQSRFDDWSTVFDEIRQDLAIAIPAGAQALPPPANRWQRPQLNVPMSPGELIDRYLILELKCERISDASQAANVRRQRESIVQLYQDLVTEGSNAVTSLIASLRDTNRALWEIENDLRNCEQQQAFGPTFVELARSVYRLNDQRASLKRQINLLLHSNILEEKSYSCRPAVPEANAGSE